MHPLTAPDPPFFHVLRGSRMELAEALVGVDKPGTVAVRTVRGTKMRTRPGAFDEIAAALQFPWYFGGNWDALEECVRDLSWLGAAHVVVAVADAAALLSDEADREALIFAGILRGAALRHASAGAGSLHLIFQMREATPPGAAAGWLSTLAPLGEIGGRP